MDMDYNIYIYVKLSVKIYWARIITSIVVIQGGVEELCESKSKFLGAMPMLVNEEQLQATIPCWAASHATCDCRGGLRGRCCIPETWAETSHAI